MDKTRVKDVRGARTPYVAGGKWQSRVDNVLVYGVEPRWLQTWMKPAAPQALIVA